MKRVTVAIVAVIFAAIGIVVGYVIKTCPKPPTTVEHVYHVDAREVSDKVSECVLVPGVVTVEKNSNARLRITNTTNENISVGFGKKIVPSASASTKKDLKPNETWEVTLDTSASGDFTYMVNGLGSPTTCFIDLPTPRIKIP